MINENIKFDFNQIQYGLIAFIADIEKKLKNYISDLPVFVLQTGDTSYYLKEKFEETDNKEIYQKVPRFVLVLNDINLIQEELANQYIRYIYKYKNEQYTCTGRRYPINISIDANFVCSNFIKMLENFSIMSTILSRPNPFTYEFAGCVYEASYLSVGNSNEMPTLDFGGQTKSNSLKFQLELQLHLLAPRIETIELLTNTEIDTVQFDLKMNPDYEETFYNKPE